MQCCQPAPEPAPLLCLAILQLPQGNKTSFTLKLKYAIPTHVIGLLQLASPHSGSMQLSLEEEKEVMPLAAQLLQLAILQMRAEADRLPVQVQHQLALPATAHNPA